MFGTVLYVVKPAKTRDFLLAVREQVGAPPARAPRSRACWRRVTCEFPVCVCRSLRRTTRATLSVATGATTEMITWSIMPRWRTTRYLVKCGAAHLHVRCCPFD